MKVYMHCEEIEFTVVISWQGEKPRTLHDILEIFCKNLSQKRPDLQFDNNHAEIYTASKRRKLNLMQSVTTTINNKDDLYVKFICLSENSKRCCGIPRKVKSVPSTESAVEKQKAKSSILESAEEQPLISSGLSRLIETMRNQAVVSVGNQKYREAIATYQDIDKLNKNNKHALHGFYTCYKKAGRYKKAFRFAEKGLKLYPDDLEFLLAIGEGYILLRDGDKALETLMKYSKLTRNSGGTNTAHKHDVSVLLAKSYLLKEQKDMAITVLQGVLRENKNHKEALAEYATLIYPLGSIYTEEAMSSLLALLATNRTDKDIKEKFAHVCTLPGGMSVLKNVAGPAWDDVTVLMFLATSLRDCGAIDEAVQLVEEARNRDPRDPNVVLTYVHILELNCKYSEGIQLIKKYMNKFPEMKTKGLKCKEFIPLLEEVGEVVDDSDVHKRLKQDLHSINTADEEKYVLATLFTLVKLLFITRQLNAIPPMLSILEPFGDLENLHKTDIRNEAAYFVSICEVMKAWESLPSPNPLRQEEKPLEHVIYLLGDSHCIPPAWQTVEIKGVEHTIHPILSTGTKIWHLRDESKFYPKVNFNSCIKQIPDGTTVLMCFGEIDCREAFPMCFDKARYDSVEDAMDTVIQIYLKILNRLQKSHHWTIFVHPVPPIIDVTRPIVTEFNKRLGARVRKEKSFHWLDITSDLLTSNGGSLREEYKLDGTHVHPRYIKLLQNSILKGEQL